MTQHLQLPMHHTSLFFFTGPHKLDFIRIPMLAGQTCPQHYCAHLRAPSSGGKGKQGHELSPPACKHGGADFTAPGG